MTFNKWKTENKLTWNPENEKKKKKNELYEISQMKKKISLL